MQISAQEALDLQNLTLQEQAAKDALNGVTQFVVVPIAQAKAATEAVQKLGNALMAPILQKRASMFGAICKSAGLEVQDCVINVETRTVSKAPAPAK